MKADTVGGCCLRIGLDRPGAGNALDGLTGVALLDALARAEDSSRYRFVMLTAAGPVFCSGLDLGEATQRSCADEVIPLLRELVMRVARSPLITIAVVNGAAIGGGVGLAAACDLVIAGPQATFRLTETLLGLIPAAILPVIARRTGDHRALALALTAEELDAAAAARAGLADQSVTDPGAAALRLLSRLRGADCQAAQALKRYYTDLYPPDWVPAEKSAAALRERLAGSAGSRLSALRKAGLLP